METWSRVIIEWINCLGVVEVPISELQQLQEDCVFYSKLIRRLKLDGNHKTIFTFIQDEYPDFILPINESPISQVYLASLMLLHTSQMESFHKPMYSLNNEAQIMIKRFLELMLPFEKNLTLDNLHTTILELSDNIPTPPVTPKDRPLRSFLNSPAAQSAYRHRIINERNRELILLKATLETERFEKADLQEDIRTHEEKIANLQKKLKERNTELKALRAEKTLAVTPQSTKKTQRADNMEQILKSEIQDLESYNSKLRSEIDELRQQQEQLSRRLQSKEQLNVSLKKNAEEYERRMDSLAVQLEGKTNELLDYRMHNEELRAQIKGIQRNNLDHEHSFEIENMTRARSPAPMLNVSEAASSIIEIQLREANDECNKLKNELNNLQEKLEDAYTQYTTVKCQNELLNEKVQCFDEIKMNLEITEDKLSKRDCQINILEMEKQTLIGDIEKYKEFLITKDKEIKNIEDKRLQLEQQLTHNNKELNSIKICLVTTEDNLAQTEATKEVLQMKINSAEDKINSLQLNCEVDTAKYREIKEMYEEKIQKLQDNINKATVKLQQVQESVRQKNIDLEHLARDLDDKNMNINTLKAKNAQLEGELHNKSSALTTAETKLCELNELREELQSQLIQERNNASSLAEQNHTIELKLTNAEVTKLELDEQINILHHNLKQIKEKNENLELNCKINEEKYEKSYEKIQILLSDCEKLSSNIEMANVEICSLKNIQENLQNRLTQEQETCMELVTEKANLEHVISKIDNEKLDLTEKIAQLVIEVEQSRENNNKHEVNYNTSNLQCKEAMETIEKLNKQMTEIKSDFDNKVQEYSELKKTHLSLITNYDESQGLVDTLSGENAAMEIAVLVCNEGKNELTEKIAILQANLEKSNTEIQKITHQFDTLTQNYTKANETINYLETKLNDKQIEIEAMTTERDALQNKLNDFAKKLEIQTEQLLEIQSTLDKVNETNSQQLIDALEQENNLKELIAELENKLILEQNACENLKLEIKLQKETTSTLKLKLDNLDEEKMESELKFKEVITGLQEVRSSHEEVLQAQSKALADRSTELDSLEKQHLEIKKSLDAQIELLKSNNDDLMKNYEGLEVCNDNNSQKIVELEKLYDEQKEKLTTTQENYTQLKIKLQNSEEEFANITKTLHAQIEQQKSVAEDLKSTLEALQLTHANDTTKIVELQQLLTLESEKLQNSTDKFAQINSDRQKIKSIYANLMLENPPQDSIVLEHTFNDSDSEELAKMLLSISKNIQSTQEKLVDLQQENISLTKMLELEKESSKVILNTQQQNSQLTDQLNSLETESKQRNQYLSSILSQKSDLQNLLEQTIKVHDEQEQQLNDYRHKFITTSMEVQNNLKANSSACDELKHLEAKRAEIETLLKNLEDRHSKSSQPLIKVFSRLVHWADNHLQNYSTVPFIKPEPTDSTSCDLSEERAILEAEIHRNELNQKDLLLISIKIDELRVSCSSYESNLKSGVVKREPSNEEKLQIALDRLTKERKELKDKLDAARVRNAKMEKNMDDLRNEIKKIKTEKSDTSCEDKSELERQDTIIKQLQRDVERLEQEKNILELKPKPEDFDQKLKEIHNEYGLKLEKIKQKMKVAYNEQIEKINSEQERAKTEKVAAIQTKMEQQCKKYTEDIAKYKAHITDLSSQFWDVGEKLLAEKQEKQIALQRLNEIQMKHAIAMSEINNQSIALSNSQLKSSSLDRDYKRDRAADLSRASFRTVQLIEEQTTTTRRHSVKSIQAMGNAFNAEDEEGEVFDNVYLADLKEGRFRATEPAPDFDRMSELRMRNSLCRPHLKSSYAVETHFHPSGLTEEDIKSGPTTDDTFNDSLSQSLLPGQKAKKKDRTQTSYKRPGPPTPSKNGGRLSLQGNELKSPGTRILRERNSERRTTTTPKRLKDFFGTSLSRRQDENAPATPKGRRLSNIFRKPRPAEKS